MMETGPLCVSCGYWVAEIGSQCETCFDGAPERGREAAVLASAVAWRRSLTAWSFVGLTPQEASLIAAVDCMLAEW